MKCKAEEFELERIIKVTLVDIKGKKQINLRQGWSDKQVKKVN